MKSSNTEKGTSGGGKSLTIFVCVSMAMIVVYTAVAILLQLVFEIVLPQALTVGWYGYWGSEIFLTARIKNVKTKSNYNTITECDDVASDSDDVLG